MANISLCMIVKNEEKHLPRCLESARPHVDEIVIVDTGSTDGTLEIAHRYGAKIFSFSWTGDFSEARNYALALVERPWVLWLDADEELDSAARTIDLRAECVKTDGDAFLVPIRNFRLDGSYEVHHAVRLFRKLAGISFEGAAHEGVDRWLGRLGRRVVPARFIVNHYGYALSEEELHRKLLRNLESLKKELARDPRDPTAHYMVGYTLFGLGERDEALRSLKTAYALKPPSKILECMILNLLSLDAYRREDYLRTERYARQSLAKISQQNTARLYLGLSLYAQERYKEAFPLLWQAYQFGRLPVLQRRTALTQEHFYKENGLLEVLAIAAQEAGERVLAAQFFRRYRMTFGETAEIIAREGLNLLYCGAYDQALDRLERSSTLGMPMEELAPPLAYSLFQSGRPEEAWALYQKYRQKFYQDIGGQNTAALLLAWKAQSSSGIEGAHGTPNQFVCVHDCTQ